MSWAASRSGRETLVLYKPDAALLIFVCEMLLMYRLRSSKSWMTSKSLYKKVSTYLPVDSIVSGERVPADGEETDSASDSEGGGEIAGDADCQHTDSMTESQPTEIQQLYRAIVSCITGLLMLSISIRRYATRDDYQRSASFDPIDPSFDINHVSQKYQYTRQKTPWLVARLGKANARRRQFLKYRENHRRKLAQELESRPEGAQGTREILQAQEETIPRDVQLGNDGSRSHAASSNPSNALTQTTATTFVTQPHEDIDQTSDPGRSETSYATSVEQDDQGNLSVPPPPKESEDEQPFECPYCFTIQTIKSDHAWKKHVFSDLRPYVCTDGDCGLRLFSRRHEWFDHELELHRKEWFCDTCQRSFERSKDYEEHLRRQHYKDLPENQLEALVEMSERPLEAIPVSACPLCDDWEESLINKQAFPDTDPSTATRVVTSRQFRNHLAHHLEQIALFALPKRHEEEISEDSSQHDEGQDQVSAGAASAGSDASDMAEFFSTHPSLLEGAVKEAQEALGEGKEDEPDLASKIYEYSDLLETRFEQDGNAGDLQESIRQAGRALRSIDPNDHLDVADFLARLDRKLQTAAEQIDGRALWPQDIHIAKDRTAGYVMLERAVQMDLRWLVRFLFLFKQEAPEETKWLYASDALFLAATHGHEAIFRLLLELEDDLQRLRAARMAALTHAAVRGHADIVRLLLHNGARSILPESAEANATLGVAVRLGHENVVSVLLESGVRAERRQNKEVNALHHAVRYRQQGVAQLLLKAGADPAVADEEFRTALHCAVRTKDERMVQVLLDGGADPEAVAGSPLKKGYTPLYAAVEAESAELVQLLLNHGANPNATSFPSGFTPLHSAARRKHFPIVKMLLERGADAEIKISSGSTPLHLASEVGSEAIARQLLLAGADINARDTEGQTPLGIALKLNKEAVARLLLTHELDVQGSGGVWKTPLHWAASCGNEEMVQTLLERGALVDSSGGQGTFTPLHDAAVNGHERVVRLLMQHGANPRLPIPDTGTALEEAAAMGYEGVVKELLDAAGRPPRKTEAENALFGAALGGHAVVVQLLLRHGVSPSMAQLNGITALQKAAAAGHEWVVRTLLDHDDYSQQRPDAREAIYEAVKVGHAAIARLLLEWYANLTSSLIPGKMAVRGTATSGKTSAVQDLLEAGPGGLGGTIGFAAEQGHVEVIRLLLEYGGDALAQSRDGLDALYKASEQGHEAVARVLLQNGANPNVKTSAGDTPLHAAARSGRRGMVRLLLDRGADMKARNQQDNTALREATNAGHKAVAGILHEALMGKETETQVSRMWYCGNCGAGPQPTAGFLDCPSCGLPRDIHALYHRSDMAWAETEKAAAVSSNETRLAWSVVASSQTLELESRRKELGDEHPKTLTIMMDLAKTYSAQNRLEEAEGLLVTVVETRMRMFGPDHPDTLQTMADLAETYFSHGRFKDAEKLHVELMEAQKRTLGVDHPTTLDNMARIANIYTKQKRWSEAEELYGAVVERRKQHLGAEHPDTVSAMEELRRTYLEQGEMAEVQDLPYAIPRARELDAQEEHDEALGRARVMARFARPYSELRQWAVAEKVLREALETRTRESGPEHRDTLASMTALASLYLEQGRWFQAQELQVAVLEIRTRTLGIDHPDTKKSMNELADSIEAQRPWPNAEELDAMIPEIRDQTLGSRDLNTLAFVGRLAEAYLANDRTQDAEALQRHVLQKYTMMLSVVNPLRLNSMKTLANTWRAWGRNDEARELMSECTLIWGRAFGSDDPDTKISQKILDDWEAEDNAKDSTIGSSRSAAPVHGGIPDSTDSKTPKVEGPLDLHRETDEELIQGWDILLGPDYPDSKSISKRLWEWGAEDNAEEPKTGSPRSAAPVHGGIPDSTDPRTPKAEEPLDLHRQADEVLEQVIQDNLVLIGRLGSTSGGYLEDALHNLELLGNIRRSRGSKVQATELLRVCAQRWEEVAGPDHPDSISIRKRLQEWQAEDISEGFTTTSSIAEPKSEIKSTSTDTEAALDPPGFASEEDPPSIRRYGVENSSYEYGGQTLRVWKGDSNPEDLAMVPYGMEREPETQSASSSVKAEPEMQSATTDAEEVLDPPPFALEHSSSLSRYSPDNSSYGSEEPSYGYEEQRMEEWDVDYHSRDLVMASSSTHRPSKTQPPFPSTEQPSKIQSASSSTKPEPETEPTPLLVRKI
ncbi:MAG: hypothetical protein M1823_000217 [Watsoniomyces obsoletus]|nr:MAG: hypothetical protein M1823_000217 [Watsoniomyces obsoletus]